MRVNRNSFLKTVGGAAAYALAGGTLRIEGAEGGKADLVLKNGAVVTMGDGNPFATAMAVKGGRILAIGSEEELKGHIGGRTRVVDLKGKGVSPGIIDAHSHLMAYGIVELSYVNIRPPRVNSFRTLGEVLREAAAKRREGDWILARGYQEFSEGRWPGREDLDKLVPRNPLLCIHWSGQFGLANTLALQKAGLLRSDVKDPYGGIFIKDRRTGVPNGRLINYPAIYSVYKPDYTDQEEMECARWGIAKFAKEGVTCVHDNFADPRSFKAYRQLEAAGDLPLRIRVYPYVASLKICQELMARIPPDRGPLVRLPGIKLAVDGYALTYDVPEDHKEFALPMHPQEIFEQIVATIHRAGYQVDVHAAGDKGVDWTLQAFEKAAGGAAKVREKRHRIEHFPFYKSDSIRKAADMGVPVCTQPYTIDFRVDDFAVRNNRLSPKQIDSMVPLKTFIKEGVHLAFGADVPAFPSNRPLDSIKSAMTRKTQGGRQLDMAEAITFMDALRVHTIGSAYAASDEKDLGSLAPGKAADFVVWNRDLRGIQTPQDIDGLHALATYVAGKPVWQEGDEL
jgi:predicted amidohydrolase YtcJ